MLKPAQKISSKGSYLTIGTRGADNETKLGGPLTFNYAPSEGSPQEIDVLDGPPESDVAPGGPGSLTIGMMLDMGSESYEMLFDLYQNGEPAIFNLYVGQRANRYDATAGGVARAKIAIATSGGETLGTLTDGVPPWGDAKSYGILAVGNHVQVANALWRIDGLEDSNYNQATKLRLTPIAGAADVGAPADYRIFTARRVRANWSGKVSVAGGEDLDASSPISQGGVTIIPESVLPKPTIIPWA